MTDAQVVAQEFSTSTADVLLLDVRWLPALSEVLRYADKARGDLGSLPLIALLGESFDAVQRSFALRGGADALLTERDPVAIVDALDQLAVRRREQAWRVLVVDDDRQQAMFCEKVLRHRGLVVESCLDPIEAEERVAAFRPDLVLLDLYMPGRNGIEVAQRIRQRAEWGLLPLVFVSGETDLEKRFDAIRMGGDDFVVKPVRPRHLIELVDARIRHAKQSPDTVGATGRREDRRGVLAGRSIFVDELLRMRKVEGGCGALVALAVQDAARVRAEVGFVGSGQLTQQIAAVLGAEHDALHPVCAAGEFRFLGLARADDETGLRRRLGDLQQRLEAREWSGGDAPLRLRFGLAAQRNDSRSPPLDAAIADLLARVVALDAQRRQAFDLGEPAAAAGDPTERALQILLRGELPEGAIHAEFQPLLPILGHQRQQYRMRCSIGLPGGTLALRFGLEQWLPLARASGRVAAIDRQLLSHALRRMKARGTELRMHLPVSIESVLDPSFAPWLMAEIQSHGLDFGAVSVAIDARDAATHASAALAGIDAIEITGARISLIEVDSDPASARLARYAAVDSIFIGSPSGAGAWESERGRLVGDLRRYGKRVIGDGVTTPKEFAELLRLKFDYALAERTAGWRAQPDYDFHFDVVAAMG
jgi:CheY-like chemotaxis protein/EAL domain-containing protein (putative c-di-GMP-specific phosphodiesterase class I)